MKRILVTYATMAGSTADVAQAIAEEIAKKDVHVDVIPMSEVKEIQGYDGVVIGAPMIMGWHRAALRFLKQNRKAFEHVPFTIFVMAMSLTQTEATSIGGVPVFVDEKLPKPPQHADHLSLKERYTQLSNYLRPIIKATQPYKPASIGVFGGRMEYGRLEWWAVLFAMLIIKAPAGDKRNWGAIRAWATNLTTALQFNVLEDNKLPQHA